MSLAERVCRRGGGIGNVKSDLPFPMGDCGGAIAAMLLKNVVWSVKGAKIDGGG